MKMNRQTIIRAAILAALSVTAIVLGIPAFVPREQGNTFVELQIVTTPEIVHMEFAAPTPSSVPVPVPVPASMPEVSGSPAPAPPATPSPKREGECFFTLDILNDTISIAYGVEEATLNKTPGWLPTSALPGKEGMCVVYGHRNRNHLKVLEKVERGDAITVTMDEGTVYTYTVSDITIYESTDDLRLPTVDGKMLVLVTCYPFRYSGHAPGKCVVTAQLPG